MLTHASPCPTLRCGCSFGNRLPSFPNLKTSPSPATATSHCPRIRSGKTKGINRALPEQSLRFIRTHTKGMSVRTPACQMDQCSLRLHRLKSHFSGYKKEKRSSESNPLLLCLTLMVAIHLLLEVTFIGSETPTFRARIYGSETPAFKDRPSGGETPTGNKTLPSL